MRRYRYRYQCIESYDMVVYASQFLLRCTPFNTPSQRVVEQELQLLSSAKINKGRDCFGNTIHYGGMNRCHDIFVVASYGVVECADSYYTRESNPSAIYKSYTHLTQLSPALTEFNKSIETDEHDTTLDVAIRIASSIHNYMCYESGATDVSTTATESFEIGKGVCQDYSHLLVALCRERGIISRYVAGYVVGTGESHAWVEVWCDGGWYGVDPTYNLKVEQDYIKVAHGRDAADCSIIRGIRRGVTNCNSQVRVIVERI